MANTIKDAKQEKGGASQLWSSPEAEHTVRTLAERESPRSAGEAGRLERRKVDVVVLSARSGWRQKSLFFGGR